MQLYADKLEAQLKQSLPSSILIAGDDILLQNDSCDSLRRAATKNGFLERERYHQESGFNWQTLLESCNALSLFSGKKTGRVTTEHI